MIQEKRKPRSYKCIDSVYNNARKVAAQKQTDLANEIEKFVTKYAQKNGRKKD